jgi:hypothetical protein
MKFVIKYTLRFQFTAYLIITILFSNCKSNENKKAPETISEKLSRYFDAPDFTDEGQTIDTLKARYNFEGVEFENWEQDDKSDSMLTVCFINGRNLPLHSTDSMQTILQQFAKSIKNVLQKPSAFPTLYMVLIERKKENLVTSNSYVAGGEFKTVEL